MSIQGRIKVIQTPGFDYDTDMKNDCAKNNENELKLVCISLFLHQPLQTKLQSNSLEGQRCIIFW